MCKLRDIVIFVAGAEFFHTLSHIALPYIVPMPLHVFNMVLTYDTNMWIIGINTIITIALLWWASKIEVKPHKRKK